MDPYYKNLINRIKQERPYNIELPTFDTLKPLIYFYHKQLLNIAVANISTNDKYAFEGGMASVNGIVDSCNEMENKMKNIFYLAQKCDKNVLEIGFNSGNSAVIFLLANPHIHIYAYDVCYHSYVKPCVEYLNSIFNNRITLIEGDSCETLKNIQCSKPEDIQIYHIDGGHDAHIVESDMRNVYNFAETGSYIILDDTDDMTISSEYLKYTSSNKIKNIQLKYDCIRYKHVIGQKITHNKLGIIECSVSNIPI